MTVYYVGGAVLLIWFLCVIIMLAVFTVSRRHAQEADRHRKLENIPRNACGALIRVQGDERWCELPYRHLGEHGLLPSTIDREKLQ